LQEGRAGKFLTGDALSHGDLAVFCNLSTLQSGWLDGAHCSSLSNGVP
jgi:glutathione S-transferase